MRGLSKKILISLFTTLVVFITVFATTYAWVGIFTYAKSDSFKMNLKVQDLDSNYFLTISSSGNPGTFSNEVPAIDLQRQIVVNRYGERYNQENENSISSLFSNMTIEPASAVLDSNNNIQKFQKINLDNTGSLQIKDSLEYYKFDLYLSVDTKEGITSTTTGIRSNVYLSNISESLVGTLCRMTFINGNHFTELPSSPINDVLKTIPDSAILNSKNAVRFALELYEPIDINNFYNNESIINSYIYQGGDENPQYDNIDNVYDLGGCLPEEQNTALQELYMVRPNYKGHVDPYLSIASERNDLLLKDENSFIWNKREHTSYLGCMDGVQTKMKISVYLWFEGWDSDCLKAILRKPVTLNLTFTSGTDD